MKGLVGLFLAIVLFGVTWTYIDQPTRNKFKRVVKTNALTISGAVFAVAVALLVSTNTNLRFL